MISRPLFYSVFVVVALLMFSEPLVKRKIIPEIVQKILKTIAISLFFLNFAFAFLAKPTQTYASNWVKVYDAYRDESDVSISLYRETSHGTGKSRRWEKDMFTHINNKRMLGDDFLNLQKEELMGEASFMMHQTPSTKFVKLRPSQVSGQQIRVVDGVESLMQSKYLDRKSILTSIEYRQYGNVEYSIFGIKISSEKSNYDGEIRLEFKSYVVVGDDEE